jgi:hypothetical protein
MPRGDKNGPSGMGPRTGRAAGLCSGYAAPGFINRNFGMGYGRGFGMGFGRGLGRGRGFGAYPASGWGAGQEPGPWNATAPWSAEPYTTEREMDVLKNQADMLKKELSSIEKRLKDLEKEES